MLFMHVMHRAVVSIVYVWVWSMVVDNAVVLSTVNEVILYLPDRELVLWIKIEQYAEQIVNEAGQPTCYFVSLPSHLNMLILILHTLQTCQNDQTAIATYRKQTAGAG